MSHRGDPAEGVLLHIKTFYRPAFRLPTGGIHTGEAVAATRSRDLRGDGLTVWVTGAIGCRFSVSWACSPTRCAILVSGRRPFATYHFLVTMPDGRRWRRRIRRSRLAGGVAAGEPTGRNRHRLEKVGQESAVGRIGALSALSHRFVARQLG